MGKEPAGRARQAAPSRGGSTSVGDRDHDGPATVDAQAMAGHLDPTGSDCAMDHTAEPATTPKSRAQNSVPADIDELDQRAVPGPVPG